MKEEIKEIVKILGKQNKINKQGLLLDILLIILVVMLYIKVYIF